MPWGGTGQAHTGVRNQGLLAALQSQGRYCLWREGTDPAPPQDSTLEKPDTHLLPTHGFKHLLELDAELLDVVHKDAGLEGWDGQEGQHQQMWLEWLPAAPGPSHPALEGTITTWHRGLPGSISGAAIIDQGQDLHHGDQLWS